MKQFQIVILAIFGIFIFVGMLFFSGAIKTGDKTPTAVQQLSGKSLTMWGVLDRETVTDAIGDFSQENQMNLVYVTKSKDTIDTELSEAIASGTGPDLVLAQHDVLLKHQSKFVHIPFDKFSDRQYRDLFVDQSKLFVFKDGIIAFPLLMDPMVFYYNRVSYNNVGIVYPPKTWQEVADYTISLTRKSGTETILESGIALGAFNNIAHAKDIFAMLLLQTGNPIVFTSTDPSGQTYSSTIAQTQANTQIPITQYVLEFITQFSDPLKASYSWNRSLPQALDSFASEQSSQYIGYASELPIIAAMNPSLNFDIAPIPQPDGVKAKKTFATMYGVAVVKASKEQFAGFQTALLMKDKNFSEKLVNSVLARFPIAPARKDLLGTPPPTQYGSILYSSALIATAWPDMNYTYTQGIFEEMVTQVLRNSKEIDTIIAEADAKMNELLN